MYEMRSSAGPLTAMPIAIESPWTGPARRLVDVPNLSLDIAKPSGIINHMVLDRSPRLDLVFHALAHPARRAIIRQLAAGERNLSELASPLKMTFPAATKHVRVLEGARLVRRRVVGREHLCRLEAAPLKEATVWTEQFRRNWEARFGALDSLLEEMKSDEQSPARRR